MMQLGKKQIMGVPIATLTGRFCSAKTMNSR